MDVKAWGLGRPAVTDLAKALAFQLGPLTVDPAVRQVSAGPHCETLEPRVMRVLVALGENPGVVLSRDDLIDLCWDGRIVGDNAINRVISLLRRTLESVAGDAVRLETITKVGFRIVVDPGAAEGEHADPDHADAEPAAPFARAGRPWTRRATLGALAVLGASGAALTYPWNRPRRHVPDPRALDLYLRGQTIQKTSLPGTMRQAMSFYQQAVTIDPQYADVWAAMAIGYRHGGDGFVKEPRSAYPRLVRSAAGRALELDPDNAAAHLALVVIESDFGRWLDQEQKLRALVRRYPDYWFSFAQLDLLLQNVGRFEEAITFRRRILELEPMVPVSWAYLARGLHYAGRDHEADIALDEGFSRWPAHPMLWAARYSILIGGKRYTEAAAFSRDPRHVPEIFPAELVEGLARIAAGLVAGEGVDHIHALLAGRPFPLEDAPFLLPIIAEAGALDLVFQALEAYLFGGVLNGQAVPPPDPQEARVTAILFAPSILAHRSDPRHARLLERSGLEEYWRKSGSRPDFRRAPQRL